MTRRGRRRSFSLLAVAGVFALSSWLVLRGGHAAKADSALVVNVKRGTLAIEILDTGRVEAREKIELKSKVAGQVVGVLAEEGARVKRGDTLVLLDPIDYEREVARAEAELSQAQATTHFAQQTLERKKSGVEQSILPSSDLDAAEHQYRTGGAALRSATVALRAAQDRVRYTKILSPIDGTVIQRNIEVGEVVTPGVQATFEGRPLLTVADLTTLLILVDLNQIDVAKVQLGQSASVKLDALPDKTYEAKITRIAPASVRRENQQTDVFPIEAELIVTDTTIKPGMTADVRIHLESKLNVLTLPIEAVVRHGAGGKVTRLVTNAKGEESREQIEVTLGAHSDRELEISSGLAEGDRILLDPASAAANELKL